MAATMIGFTRVNEEIDSADAVVKPRYLSLFILATGFIPISFGFALQYANLTTYVMSLGVSGFNASLVWLCGPVTGLVVQPWVGRLVDEISDKAGNWLLLLAVVLFGGSQVLIACATDLTTQSVFPFILGFWIFDASANAISIVLRSRVHAFVGNCEKSSQLALSRAFGLQQLCSSVGYISGYWASEVTWKFFTCNRVVENCSQVKTVFLVNAALTISVFILHFAFLRPSAYSKSVNGISGRATRHPQSLSQESHTRTIYLATSLSWFGWFSALIYQTHFVASEVGTFSLREASAGLRLGAILSGVTSLVLPLVLNSAENLSDLWWVWSAGCGFLGVLLLAGSPVVKYMHDLKIGIFWLGAFGLVHAISSTVPYTLLTAGGGGGRDLGLLNVFVCLPQISVSLVAGPMNAFVQSDLPAFLLGGLCALGAAVLLHKQAETIMYQSIV